MAKVTILGLGHALIAGSRGDRGGKPSKDSVWGFAQVDNVLLSFGGRRGGVLRYKTFKKTEMDKLEAQWLVKQAGSDKGFAYVAIEGDVARDTLIPNLGEVIGKGYYKSAFLGKLNTRNTKGGAPKKVDATKVFEFPTAKSMAAKAKAAAKAAK